MDILNLLPAESPWYVIIAVSLCSLLVWYIRKLVEANRLSLEAKIEKERLAQQAQLEGVKSDNEVMLKMISIIEQNTMNTAALATQSHQMLDLLSLIVTKTENNYAALAKVLAGLNGLQTAFLEAISTLGGENDRALSAIQGELSTLRKLVDTRLKQIKSDTQEIEAQHEKPA